MNFNPDLIYPNVQPYESHGYNRYCIAAAWNDQNGFTAGDESRTMATHSGVNETYFNANLIDSLLIVTM